MPPITAWSEDNVSLTILRQQRNQPTDGIDVIDRTHLSANSVLWGTTGNVRLTAFTPTRDMTVSKITAACGAAANYGTATGLVVKYGLYTVNVDTNAVTLVASTTHDATLFTGANQAYQKPLNTSYTLLAGQRYAAGLIIYNSGGTITTMPNFVGINGYSQVFGDLTPRIAHLISSQTDLPSSATTGGSGSTLWFRLNT